MEERRAGWMEGKENQHKNPLAELGKNLSWSEKLLGHPLGLT